MNAPNANQTRFNQAAASWDENPARQVMANTIAAAMLAAIPIESSMTVLDFGCGTGLVSLALQPHVQRVIGIDITPGMLAIFDEKVRAYGITNVETHCLDLCTQSAPDLQADVIVSAMALHHIADLPSLLPTLVQLLTPGGYLAFADLDSEDGSFHEDKTGVYHDGLERDWLISQLQVLGIQDITAVTAHTIERPTGSYPIFLISGRKPTGVKGNG